MTTTAEEQREFQAQVNAFGSAARAAARQEGTVSSDKLALQKARHDREVARVHAHYQGQVEALNAQLLAERGRHQQPSSAPASAPAAGAAKDGRPKRRAARAGGAEGTSSTAAFVDGERPLPPRAAATAEEAAYLRKRLEEVQELFDLVRVATAVEQAGRAGGSRTVPGLGFDPTFGGAAVVPL